MSRVITLMPVRLAATRLPNKPLRVINGKTMVQRVYENVKKALNTDIAIAAGDQAIVDECKKFGATAILTDPNLPSGTDRIAAALKELDPDGSKYDIVVDFQGDNINVDPKVTLPLIEMVERTGCDSLAISIGTSHGAYKFTPAQCTRDANGRLVPPPLAFDVLDAVMKELPGFPIVLHGSSSVPQEYVDIINQYGGKLPDAIGIPEEQLRKAAKSAVCKINIDSDSRLAMTAAVRKVFAEKPAEFDPRKYLGPARDEMERLYKHKIENVLGSAGKAE